MRMLLTAAVLLASIGTAGAQTAPAAGPVPTGTAAPLDPARLAVSQRLVARLVPKGIYRQLFDKIFTQMMERMVGQMGEMPIGQVARMGGITEAEAKALGQTKLREVMEIYDPAWKARQSRTMQAFSAGIGDLMETMEPTARVALGRAYAREFSVAELEDLDRYFATPAGSHYASRSLTISMGPDMMDVMNEMMPKMMEAMPALIKQAEAATADLPPVRTKGDLSPAERKKLAELLGVDPETLD